MPVITKRISDYDGKEMDNNAQDAVSVLYRGEVTYFESLDELRRACDSFKAAADGVWPPVKG